MADEEKNDSFSFDNDPGKLTDKDDVEFTFSDIPVLGVEKDKKETFSFDELPEGEDASIASFEAMLKESPEAASDEEYDDATRTTMEVERVKLDRKAKKKKKLLIRVAIAGAVLLVLCLIGGAVMFFVAQAQKRAEEEAKKLSPAEKRALEIKQQREKIQKIVEDADSNFKAGETSKAADLYSQVLKIDSGNPGALTGAGRCASSLGKGEEAEEYYKKAVEHKNADSRPFASLSTIYLSRKEYEPAIALLEKGMEKFPDDKALLIPLADAYNKTGVEDKALEVYKKVPKSSLLMSSLKTYARLMTLESKADAKKLYIYTANKFKDLDCYLKASELADDEKDKVQILTDSVAALKEDEKNLDNAKFMLAKALIESGDNAKATSNLRDVKIEKLNPEYCTEILGMAKQAGVEDLTEFCRGLLKARPDDFELQKTVQKQLLLSKGPEVVLELYSDWWSKNSSNPIANYLYAKSLGYSEAAKKYYHKALVNDPKFFHASMELGKIAMDEKNWQEAEKNFAKSAKNMKNDKKVRYLYALAKVKNGKGQSAIQEYANFLDAQGLTPSQKAAEVVPLAMLLPTPQLADGYLAIIKEDPALQQEYKLNKAKRHLLFKGNPGDAFSGAKKGTFREYVILNMLSQGKEKEILMMPTPAKEFPDFWKVFIARRKNFKNWKKSAAMLLAKHKNDADPTIKIISSLWLRKIKLADAEKMFNRIPFDKEALFYMILAEEYKREKKIPKAKIRYRKAKSCGRNVYSGVVDYYSRKL